MGITGERRYEVTDRDGLVLAINVDDELVALEDVEWLRAFLRQESDKGVVFGDGETIQIGWMIDSIKARSPREVGIFEPDMRSVPLAFVDSMTKTLQHVRLHHDVADSLDITPDFPSLRQSAITCVALASEGEALIERDTAVDEHDSGWFIGCTQTNHDHNSAEELHRVSLYSAVLKCPAVLPYVALPTGARVYLSNGMPMIFIDDYRVPIRKGSFLDRYRSSVGCKT